MAEDKYDDDELEHAHKITAGLIWSPAQLDCISAIILRERDLAMQKGARAGEAAYEGLRRSIEAQGAEHVRELRALQSEKATLAGSVATAHAEVARLRKLLDAGRTLPIMLHGGLAGRGGAGGGSMGGDTPGATGSGGAAKYAQSYNGQLISVERLSSGYWKALLNSEIVGDTYLSDEDALAAAKDWSDKVDASQGGTDYPSM